MQFSSVTNNYNAVNQGNDIVALYPTNNVRVPVGTAFASINFSGYRVDQVLALLNDGSLQRLTVTWAAGSYSTSAGTYSISGTITLPTGITNNNNIAATLSVQVVALETEYQTVLTQGTTNGATLPTPINQGDENAQMASLKSNSILASLNIFRSFATDGNSAFAKLNWVTPASFLATDTNSPNYSLLGVKGNGTNSRVDEVWVPSTNGGSLYTQNDAGFGIYISEKASISNLVSGPYVIGTISSSTFKTGIRFLTGQTQVFVNSGTGQTTNPEALQMGYYHVFRTSSTTLDSRRFDLNPLVSGSTSSTSAGVPAFSPDVLALHNNASGTHALFGDMRVAVSWWGASLSAKISQMYQTIAAYMRDMEKRPYFPYTSLEFFGDSMTEGTGTDFTVWTNLLFKYYFADAATITNNAIGGTSFWKQGQAANTKLADAGLTSIWCDLTGWNSAHQSSGQPPDLSTTLGKCEAYMRTVFVAHSAHSYTAASAATNVSNYGSAINCVTDGANPDPGGRFTTGRYNAGGTAGIIRYTFTGPKRVAVQFLGTNGNASIYQGAYGSCKIYLDGVLQESVNLNANWTDDLDELSGNVSTRISVAFFYYAKGSGSHTLDVVADGNGICPVDFFAELNDPQVVLPFLFSTVVMASDGVVANTVFQRLNYKRIQMVNMFKNFGYICAIGEVNAPGYYDYLTQVKVDGIHPDEFGDVSIMRLFKDTYINQILK